MKKRFFSIATVVLLLVLALSVMVACGDKENGTQTDGSQESSGEQEETPITSEVGLTYVHTKTTITFASDEAKATMLDEMECTEETFFNLYDQATLEVKFLAENKTTVVYNLGGGGSLINLYYKVENRIVTFYSTEEDMQNGNAKTDVGVFAAQFKLSEDYKTLQWIAEVPNKYNITLNCTIAK